MRKFSPFGKTATDAWLLSTFSCFRAPQEPPPLIHDAKSGVKRRLDERYYTRAFICYREKAAVRRSFGLMQPEGYPVIVNQKAAPTWNRSFFPTQ